MSKRESYGKDYAKNRGAYITRAQKHYQSWQKTQEGRLRRMLIEAKSRAKSKEVEFEITPEDIKWNDVCPILGTPIVLNVNSGRGGLPDSPSLDRIDNTKGYVAGNVRIISWRANKIKRDMSYEECKALFENWNRI